MAGAKPSDRNSPATSQLQHIADLSLILPGDTKGPQKFDHNNLQKNPGVKVPGERLILKAAVQQRFQAEGQSCNRDN